MHLRSDRIQLTTTRPEHLDSVLALERDNSNSVFNWSRQQHLEAMAAADFRHMVVQNLKADFIGYIILRIDADNKTVEFKRIVIGPKGQGFGRETVELLKIYVFEELRYHRLWLDVYTDNHPAIALYTDLGFVQEGLLRDCKLSAQGYRSMLLMSMLEQEYAK